MWIRARSYGAMFDIVAAPEDVAEDLAPEAIVRVGAWMVGTLE
jgi:hypothetical protein